MMSRRCKVKVNFRGADISEYVESFTYSDNTDFTDDVSVVLSDKDRFWSNKFFPETGDILTAEISVCNWNKANDNRSIKLGSFEIDDINYSVTKLTLNAVAVPIFSSIRDEKNYKTWENVKLSVIANDIAKRRIYLLFLKAILTLSMISQSKVTNLIYHILRNFAKRKDSLLK